MDIEMSLTTKVITNIKALHGILKINLKTEILSTSLKKLAKMKFSGKNIIVLEEDISLIFA